METSVLVRSREKLPLIDLPSQHCAAVSEFAERHRHTANSMRLRGPFVGFRVVQSLTLGSWPLLNRLQVVNAAQLEVDSFCHLSDSLPSLQKIIMRIAVSMQQCDETGHMLVSAYIHQPEQQSDGCQCQLSHITGQMAQP